MNVQPVTFGARIKISGHPVYNTGMATSGTTAVGSTAAGSLGTTATRTLGSAADILGTAFSAKASGIDSFGIVPSVLAEAAPHVTPQTLVSVEANPSIMGSLFSSLGSWLYGESKISDNKPKDPS